MFSLLSSRKGTDRDPNKVLDAPLATRLTIRNLTALPIELKVVARYEALVAISKNDKNQSYFALPQQNETTEPPSPRLAKSTKSFSQERMSTMIREFTTYATQIPSPQMNAAKPLKLRLTFDIDGQGYRVEVPDLSTPTSCLTPLSPSPKYKFTAVYFPRDAFLAIYSSSDLCQWMQYLDDATSLSALSIPGTHNSPTYHRALPSVRCQAVGIREQLENGVRFFDLRVQTVSRASPQLIMVHSVFPISLTGTKYFHDVLGEFFAFLDANPSECLILSLKREGTGDWDGTTLAQVLYDHYMSPSNPNASRWYTDPSVPILGAVRGKIVLLRRFPLDDALHAKNSNRGWGLDAECWADNTACDFHGAVCVQDRYEIDTPAAFAEKTAVSRAHCRLACQNVAPLPGITTDANHPVPPGPLFLNFLTANNFWRSACWPEKVAEKMNPAMVEWLCMEHARDLEEKPADNNGVPATGADRNGTEANVRGDGSTGIVICDWVGKDGDWDLVRCIVGMNARLMARQKGLI